MNVEFDNYLFRIATIIRIAPFEHDPMMVPKEDVDMTPKNMYYRIRRLFEEEYEPTFSINQYDEDIVIQEFKEAYLTISDNLEHAVDVLATLMALEVDLLKRLRVLTQFLKDNPTINDIQFYNLTGALYFIEE